MFIRATEAEVAAAGSRSLWGEPVETLARRQPGRHARAGGEKIQTYVDLGCTGLRPVVRRLPGHARRSTLLATEVMPEFR